MELDDLIKQKNELYHELSMELIKPTELLHKHKEEVAKLCYCLAFLESKIAEILFTKGGLENSVINLISQAAYLTDVHEYGAARCALTKAKDRTKKEAVIKHIDEELIKLKQQMEKI